ncbi:hypothetical protein MN608_08650 [Microdochium nivale]|nr:hypothetical protein MN608_08650 [Microdochium nivale]
MVLRVIDKDFASQIDAQIEAAAGDGARHVEYTITLPLLLDRTGDRMLCHEVSAETAAVSAHLSERVHALYSQLGSNRAVLANDAPISVTITIGQQGFHKYYPHCPHRRFHSRRLRLLDTDKLPNLDFVHRLVVDTEYDSNFEHEFEDMRPLSLLMPLHCLSHLPAVHTLELPWMWERPTLYAIPDKSWQNDGTRPWEGPLRDARHEFGAALLLSPEGEDPSSATIRVPETLRRAVLYFWKASQFPVEDHSLPRPDLVSPAPEDPVSLGLSKLAAQLEVFDLRALITPALFQTTEGGATREVAQWPRMRRLKVEFHLASPDGLWYFDGPADGRHNQRNYLDRKDENQTFAVGPEHYPREAAAPEIEAEIHDVLEGRKSRMVSTDPYNVHLFRVVPRRETVEPLLKAFAKAIARDNMPCLVDAELFAWLCWRPRVEEDLEDDESLLAEWETYRWGVKYISSTGQQQGEEEKIEGENRREGIVQWQVGDWRPSQDVLDVFEQLGIRQEWLDFEVRERRSSTWYASNKALE